MWLIGAAIGSRSACLHGESPSDVGKFPGVTGEEEGEWQLYWTARHRPVPCRLVPLLSGWADLDQREDVTDIGPGHPILIDPEYRLDPLLARFLRSMYGVGVVFSVPLPASGTAGGPCNGCHGGQSAGRG